MLVLLLLACQNDNDRPADPEAEAVLAVKEHVTVELDALHASARAIQTAAPDLAGWSAGETDALQAAWKDARIAYEHVEGAIAVLFPDLDFATDERYDGFLAEGPDDAPFDDQGVIGVHAVERIAWADAIPAEVVAFEEGLPGYTAARFPATEAEAGDFAELLCGRLVDDVGAMVDGFAPVALDSAAAFRGVIGSMEEQAEKVNLAGAGQDESRYAQHTLADMRANLAGAETVYAAFQPWVLATDGGDALDADILAGFARVEAAYAAIPGEAVPPVPATWNPDAPTEADLATPYGQLWAVIIVEADPSVAGSLVERLTAAADLLGIPQLAG